MVVSKLRVAAVNDELKHAEIEFLSFNPEKHLKAMRRLHSCIENFTEMIVDEPDRTEES